MRLFSLKSDFSPKWFVFSLGVLESLCCFINLVFLHSFDFLTFFFFDSFSWFCFSNSLLKSIRVYVNNDLRVLIILILLTPVFKLILSLKCEDFLKKYSKIFLLFKLTIFVFKFDLKYFTLWNIFLLKDLLNKILV